MGRIQLNNQIGRNLGLQVSKNSDLARNVLNTYANQGLYEAVKNSSGTYDVKKVKLNSEIYKIAIDKLKTLDQTGAGKGLQKKRIELQKNIINRELERRGIKNANKKCSLEFFLIGIFILSLSYRFFIYEKFETRKIERDDLEVNTVFKLADLTNFKWDTARLSISSEYFEKITFYNKDIEIYGESVKFDSDVRYESQYLFENTNKNDVISSYKCPYSSSIKLKKIEKISEEKVTLYIYEPIGCMPIH